jgi:hypothetical protein
MLFIKGMLKDPVPTTLATALPDIVPKRELAITATFAGPPRNEPNKVIGTRKDDLEKEMG